MTWIIVAVVVVLLIVSFVLYNSLIKAKNTVDESWSQIDVQLKRRADLIPNLVNTVKGYATHEKSTFDEITQARQIIQNPNLEPQDAAKAEEMMSGGLGRLLAIAENYPDLKASANFLSLQEELGTTENKIAFARQYYNDSVRQLNTKIQSVPTNLFVGIAKISPAQYFLVDDIKDRETPNVQF